MGQGILETPMAFSGPHPGQITDSPLSRLTDIGLQMVGPGPRGLGGAPAHPLG